MGADEVERRSGCIIECNLSCRYYNKGEIRDFENNECEWPIFYTYMIIDGVFKNNTEQIEEYQAELRKCMYSDECGGECAPISLSIWNIL